MDFRAVLMGISFSVMWSSAFATARILVAGAPPFMTLSMRFALAGFVAILIARALGQDWRLDAVQARSVIIFGLCQNALYLGLNFVAMQKIEASLASIIASSMPLIVAGMAWVWRGEKMKPLGMAGLIIGFSGVTLIMGSRISGGADAVSVVYCLIGAAALGIATLTVSSASKGGNLLMIVGLQMWVGALALAIVAGVWETGGIDLDPKWIAAFFYQVFIPGLLATFIWFSLVGRVGAIKASAFHFLNPFFGVVIAALLLGEHIGVLDMVGVAVAALGILAVQLSKMKV
jgi:probable blue pigment (indigoidine) exporter